MIDLPQPRRQPQARLHAADMGWSPADELATLEVVWESLCHDAVSPTTALQLPTIPIPQVRGGGQRPVRLRNRPLDAQGRLAS